MSGYYNLGKAASKTPIGKKIVEKVTSFFKPKSKVSKTINSVPPSQRNKTFGEQKEKISKTVDKFGKGVNQETKIKMRGGTAPTLGRISKILKGEKVGPGSSNPKRPGKKDGGRMGLKFGSGTKRKSNIEKIKETFGPKKTLSPKQMKIASLAGNKKKIDGPDFAKLRSKKS